MISVVVSIGILMLAALGVLVGVLRARKKPLSAAICRLAFTLIALCVTIPVTALIAWAAAGSVVTQIRAAAPNLDALLADLSSMIGWIRAFCAALIASLLFLILFPIFTALLRIPVKPLSRLLDEKVFHRGTDAPQTGNGKNNPWGMVLGGVCGLVFAVAMLAPTVGTLRIVGDIASLPAALTDPSEEADDARLLEAIAAPGDALGVKAVWYIGGAPVYHGITTYRVGDSRMSAAKETALFGDLADYLLDPSENKGNFSGYSSAAGRSALIGEVLPDLFEKMFDRWSSGEPYFGIAAPASDGRSGDFLDSGLREFSELSRDQLRESMLAMVDLAAYLLDYGGTGSMDTLFTDEDRLTDVYACLIRSEALHNALKSALDSVLQEMTRNWSGSEIILAGVMPTDADGSRKEARGLARATIALMHFNESYSLEGENLSDTLYNLGEILDGFKETDMIGEEQTRALMESALRSEEFREALGYDSARAEDAIDDILKELDNKSYADLLSSLVENSKE